MLTAQQGQAEPMSSAASSPVDQMLSVRQRHVLFFQAETREMRPWASTDRRKLTETHNEKCLFHGSPYFMSDSSLAPKEG